MLSQVTVIHHRRHHIRAMSSNLTLCWTLIFCIQIACVFESVSTSHESKDFLEELDFDDSVEPLLTFSKELETEAAEVAAAPRYMMKLYEEYTRAHYPLQRHGNTVRSVNAQIGMINGQEMFLFNLSAVASHEVILRGELHVYQRSSKKREDRSDAELVVHQVASSYIASVESVIIAGDAIGWQAVDVTSSVENSVLQRRDTENYLLAVSFKRDHDKVVSLKRFMKQSHRPFIIVFSNETQNITLDHIDPHFSQPDVMIDPKTGKNIGKSENLKYSHSKPNIDKSEPFSDNFTEDTELASEAEEPSQESRDKRSLLDNEIPMDIVEPPLPKVEYNLPEIQPNMLRPVAARPQPTPAPSRLIPYPEEYIEQKRKRKNRRRNRKQKKEERILPMPANWHEEHYDMQEKHYSTANQQTQCGLRQLWVDFADIGLNEWIIAPDGFAANYCSGRCSFPMPKSVGSSNHAIIQGMINKIGIFQEVSEPCCVPESMTSVSLLFYDESRNVVLKTYPDMSVLSCACR